MGNKKDAIYKRLNALETSKASSEEKVSNILDIVKEFTTDFKQHDEREMAKYEKYDRHVQDLDKTLQQVVSGLDIVQKGHEDQDKKHLAHTTNLSKHREATDKEFKAVNSKLNKGIGAVLAIIAIIGVVAFVYDIMSAKQKVSDDENRELKKEVATMKNLMNRNYGAMTGIPVKKEDSP